MRNVSHICGKAFGIVADSKTLCHDEAPNLSLLIKILKQYTHKFA